MVDNHGYPTGVWYTMRTKFPPKNFKFVLILDTRRDTIWTVMDDTDGTPPGAPPRF